MRCDRGFRLDRLDIVGRSEDADSRIDVVEVDDELPKHRAGIHDAGSDFRALGDKAGEGMVCFGHARTLDRSQWPRHTSLFGCARAAAAAICQFVPLELRRWSSLQAASLAY